METPNFEGVGVTGIYEKPEELPTLAALEQRHILNTLAAFNGNKTKAARQLDISLKTLYNKLHAYGVMEKDDGKTETERIEAAEAQIQQDQAANARKVVKPTKLVPGDTSKLTKFFDV